MYSEFHQLGCDTFLSITANHKNISTLSLMIRVNLEIIRHKYFVIDRNAYVLTQICKRVIINRY